MFTSINHIARSILHGYKLILTSLLVSMGISTFTSKEFVIFCRASKIGNDSGTIAELYGKCGSSWLKWEHQ